MPTFARPTEIAVIDRQRQRPPSKDSIEELAKSIRARGLLHAPVVIPYGDGTPEGTPYRLVAGERRLEACKLILESFKEPILYNQQQCPEGTIPLTLYSRRPTELELARAEMDENLLREDLHWTDRTRALAHIQELEEAISGRAQTDKETADELVERGVAVGSAKTSSSLRQAIGRAKIIQQHLDDPAVAGARNEREAYDAIIKKSEREARAKLREVSGSDGLPDVDFRLGDALEVMPALPQDTFDLILCDPPYGIGAHGAGFRARSKHRHEYDDTLKSARKFLPDLMMEAFRVAKPRANLFLFTDIQHWDLLLEAASRIGWVPWRTAIVWNKSQTEGQAPWGNNGFTRTHELIFYATKGQRGLYYSVPDVLYAKRVQRTRKVFAAQKPHDLLRQLIAPSTIEGDTILDPCAGSGSTLRTARLMGRRPTGIELNPETYEAGKDFVYQESEVEETTEVTVENL